LSFSFGECAAKKGSRWALLPYDTARAHEDRAAKAGIAAAGTLSVA
jgi:hypothetical protein